ncbi:MAG: hypothetical protein AAF802_13175 [Planctomycetota bacterium]
MNKKTKPNSQTRSTVVYGKFFAFLGVLAGLLLAFGTPGFLLANIHDREIRELVESLPTWAIPTLLCIGIGGGVVVVAMSVAFGLLIPSKVTRGGSEAKT